MSNEQSADLHAHTTCSDGVLTPEELVAAAVEAELTEFAITDHDTVNGVARAQRAASEVDVEVIPGIELSSYAGGREIHILGLFIEPETAELSELTKRQRAYREERAEVMLARLRDLGIPIDLEAVNDIAAGAPIGRPHMAVALVRAGIVDATQEAFDRYLGIGRPAFVPKRATSSAAVIDTIHRAGGVAVVAHPGSSRVRATLLGELATLGLDGIEVRHPRHPPRRQRSLMELCDGLGLLPSGGSDFHGPGRGDTQLGQYRIPIQWSDRLRNRAEQHRAAGEEFNE
jgi:predicted metal-dependent phosphoesterase TrpH